MKELIANLIKSSSSLLTPQHRTPFYFLIYQGPAGESTFRNIIDFHNNDVKWVVNHGFIAPIRNIKPHA
jgi:hypothetical protein